MKTLYTITYNRRVYVTTDILEMTGFALFLGILGAAEVGPDVGQDVTLQLLGGVI